MEFQEIWEIGRICTREGLITFSKIIPGLWLGPSSLRRKHLLLAGNDTAHVPTSIWRGGGIHSTEC